MSPDVRAVYREDPAAGVGAIRHRESDRIRFQKFGLHDGSTAVDPLQWLAADAEAVVELEEAV